MSSFEKSARRALDVAYRRYGDACVYTPSGGDPWPEVLGIFKVAEAQENLEGASVEAVVKGYSLRLRTWLFPDGQKPVKGGLITLDEPFDGHRFFHVDSEPKAFQGGGRQAILPLTPTKDPDTAPIAGWNFS